MKFIFQALTATCLTLAAHVQAQGTPRQEALRIVETLVRLNKADIRQARSMCAKLGGKLVSRDSGISLDCTLPDDAPPFRIWVNDMTETVYSAAAINNPVLSIETMTDLFGAPVRTVNGKMVSYSWAVLAFKYTLRQGPRGTTLVVELTR
jgi:hypothetical protein